MSPLRKQMQDAMVLRGLAARTQESYIAAVVGIAKYYRRSPDTLSSDEVERYLLHLIEDLRFFSQSFWHLMTTSENFRSCALLKSPEYNDVIDPPDGTSAISASNVVDVSPRIATE